MHKNIKQIKVVYTAMACGEINGLKGVYRDNNLDINITYIPEFICISTDNSFSVNDVIKCNCLIRKKLENCEELRINGLGIGKYNASLNEYYYGENINGKLDKSLKEVIYYITYNLYCL